MIRRYFLSSAACASAATLIPSTLFGAFMQETGLSDEQICRLKFDLAVSKDLAARPISEIVAEIGRSFIGTEYAGHTLEDDGEEKLVVNLRALDCVTFYENCVTLARCIKLKKTTFEEYKAQLQFLRYRDGVIDGYPSRLHYTSDYWFNAEKKGILKVVTAELFGEKNCVPIPKPVNFMSENRDKYKHLKTNDANLAKIRAQEEAINARTTLFLPKGNLHMFADKVPHGSVIGITTNIKGMDVTHTGVAVRMPNGALHFMHAPNVGYKVQITDVPMHDYLAKNQKQTGIIVASVMEIG